MRLRAPLSFVCTFIYGQLLDRKHHLEDSFVTFGETGEDSWGDAVQQPFGTSWSPPLLLLGAPGGDESSWFSALKPGDGEACRVSHALAPPPSNRPSPALAPSVGLNNPEAARLCVGGRSKTQPLPLAAPPQPRGERIGAGLALGK